MEKLTSISATELGQNVHPAKIYACRVNLNEVLSKDLQNAAMKGKQTN